MSGSAVKPEGFLLTSQEYSGRVTEAMKNYKGRQETASTQAGVPGHNGPITIDIDIRQADLQVPSIHV